MSGGEKPASTPTNTGRGRSQTRDFSFKKALSLSPTTKRYVGLQREIVHEQQFMKQAFENGDINAFRGAQSTLEDLYTDRSSIESAMKGRQTYRHCKEGDPRAFVDVAEFVTSFVPGVGGTVANLAANAAGAKMDYDRGLINRQEYLARLAMSGVGAGTSMKPTASHFTKPLGHRFKDRLNQTGERAQEAFEHFIQSGGHAPKPAFAHAKNPHHAGSKFRSHSAPHGTNTWFTKQGPSRTAQPPRPIPTDIAEPQPVKPTDVPSSQRKPNTANLGGEGAASSKPNYKESGSEFSLRIDPETRQGPMHVDMRGMKPVGGTTKYGIPRNAPEFWKVFNEKYPGKLSERNIELIKVDKSPWVDANWVKQFPEHQKFLGQKLEHHHLDHLHMAYPLPKYLHRGRGNMKVWHELGE